MPPKKGKKKDGKKWEKGSCTMKCAGEGAKCGKHSDCCGAPTGDLQCVNLDNTWVDPFTKAKVPASKNKLHGRSNGLYCVRPTMGLKLGEVGVQQSTTLSPNTHTILFSVTAACALAIVGVATYLMRRRIARSATIETYKSTSPTTTLHTNQKPVVFVATSATMAQVDSV